MRTCCAVVLFVLTSTGIAFSQSAADNPLIQLLQGQPPGGAKPKPGPHPGHPQAPPKGVPVPKPASKPAAKNAAPDGKAAAAQTKGTVDPKAAAGKAGAAAAGKAADAKQASGAEGPPLDEADKNDPALLESIPTRELPEDANAAHSATQGELTSERVQTEFRLIDVNKDGTISYLEARDRNQVDLATFRQFDADNSGLLDVQEFESQMVLLAASHGQPVEKTLKNRVDRFVDKTKARIEEERAKSLPSASAEKMYEYLDKKMAGLQSHMLKNQRTSIPRPTGLPPRSPRQPLHPGY